ncbi:MAG: type IV pilus modification protein PilV [Rhizobacter sp.]
MRRGSAKHQAGFGMIEVLVAVIILAFGMLGLLGLQTKAMSLNQSSLQRSQATALTDDILDRLRTDKANARLTRWNTGLEDTAASITGSALYQTDLHDWKLQVEALLPNGAASVAVAGGTVTIVIQWSDTHGRDAQGATTDPLQFQTQTQL